MTGGEPGNNHGAVPAPGPLHHPGPGETPARDPRIHWEQVSPRPAENPERLGARSGPRLRPAPPPGPLVIGAQGACTQWCARSCGFRPVPAWDWCPRFKGAGSQVGARAQWSRQSGCDLLWPAGLRVTAMAAFVLLRQGRAGALKVKGSRAVPGSPRRAGASSAALAATSGRLGETLTRVPAEERAPGPGSSRGWGPANGPPTPAGLPLDPNSLGSLGGAGLPGGVRRRALPRPFRIASLLREPLGI